MELYIAGIGRYTSEINDYAGNISTLEEDSKRLMTRSLRRLSARLAAIFYVAMDRALSDFGQTNNIAFPVVAGTGISEVDAGYELVQQIYNSKGASISPTLVQNSVHNAPAGFISIGYNITLPVITLAHSFLSWEACVDYSFNFLYDSPYEGIILIAGDQFLPEWIDKLNNLGIPELSNSLKNENLKEGAVAMVLTRAKPDKCYGTIHQGAVLHMPKPENLSRQFLNKYDIRITDKTRVILRELCLGFLGGPDKVQNALGLSPEQIIYYPSSCGMSLATPFNLLINGQEEHMPGHYLLIASEYNDLALVELSME